jgi:hypothetical protein
MGCALWLFVEQLADSEEAPNVDLIERLSSNEHRFK